MDVTVRNRTRFLGVCLAIFALALMELPSAFADPPCPLEANQVPTQGSVGATFSGSDAIGALFGQHHTAGWHWGTIAATGQKGVDCGAGVDYGCNSFYGPESIRSCVVGYTGAVGTPTPGPYFKFTLTGAYYYPQRMDATVKSYGYATYIASNEYDFTYNCKVSKGPGGTLRIPNGNHSCAGDGGDPTPPPDYCTPATCPTLPGPCGVSCPYYRSYTTVDGVNTDISLPPTNGGSASRAPSTSSSQQSNGTLVATGIPVIGTSECEFSNASIEFTTVAQFPGGARATFDTPKVAFTVTSTCQMYAKSQW